MNEPNRPVVDSLNANPVSDQPASAAVSPGLSVLYRGPLSSCNYRCGYCPFAKRRESKLELEHDQRCLNKFRKWVESRPFRPHSILFTPWGEALTRRWYREAMVDLSHQKHVARVAVQTNLSCNLSWLTTANRKSIALWCTFHPEEVTRKKFIGQCHALDEIGIRYSVGIVGMKENIEPAEALRNELPEGTYVWINAYKREPDYYDDDLFRRFERIDPHFPTNAIRHPSLGNECRTGDTVVSIDGNGDVKRCHFVDQVLGNIYESEIEELLAPRRCPNVTCGCHIGYVHMPKLDLYSLYGNNVLERIPKTNSSHSAALEK